MSEQFPVLLHQAPDLAQAAAPDLAYAGDPLPGEMLEVVERLRRVGRATNDVIWDCDLVTGRGYWSDALSRVFGYAAEAVETTHEWWVERIHPADRDRVTRGISAVLEGDAEIWSGEYRFRRADGSYASVLDRSYIARDRMGRPVRMSGSMMDLSERRRTEEALRESEARFRQLAECIDAAFWLYDVPSGRILYRNPSFQRIWGLPGEAAYHEAEVWAASLHPEDRQRVGALVAERGGQEYSVEYRIVRPDGEVRWIHDRAFPVRDADGTVHRMAGLAEDVTEHRRAREALHASEASYRTLFNSVTELVSVQDLDGRILNVNDAVVREYGYTREQLLRLDPAVLVDEQRTDRAEMREHFARAAAGEPQRFELWTRAADGTSLPREVVLTRGTYFGQDVVIAVARDVAERKRAEDQDQRLAALSRENPNPVLECAADGKPLHANPAAETIARELGLASVTALLPANHAQLVRSALQDNQGYQVVETVVGERIFSWSYRPDTTGGVVYLFAVDITGRRHVEEQLRHDALHDALTGLPNRALFMERLAHVILRSKRRDDYHFAVLFLDLDRFKVINDSLGHHVGDELLVGVAQRLLKCLRTEDTVARFGGDEFAILLESIGGLGDATRVAERIQAELSAPVNLSGFEVFTSASIGIALSSSAYERPEYLLRNADMAMYRAKAGGQARYEVFDRTMHAAALARLQLETDLRRALERGEFHLVYQPIMSVETGRLHAVEALIRWSHPDRGNLEPDAFISLAEETGLILPIGSWVLGEACRQLREWRDRLGERAPASVGVNLSAKQFSQHDLVERIGRVLETHRLAPQSLWLEITESAVMENADTAVVLLGRMKALGVQISLDDFGTGYSSLSYLHRFPLDALKIDRSFVGRMDQEERSAHLVQTVLTLARSLGVSAVAEGIETAAQLHMLRTMGCGLGQGYLFAHPLRPAELERLL